MPTTHTDPHILIHRFSHESDLTMAPLRLQPGVPARFSWRPHPGLPEEFGAQRIPGGEQSRPGTTHPVVSGIAVPVQVDQYDFPSRHNGYGVGVEHPQGRRWVVRLRPATADEAAPVLAAEAAQFAHARLALSTRDLLAWLTPDQQPDAVPASADLTPGRAAEPVPCTDPSWYDGHGDDQLLVDNAAGLVWTLTRAGHRPHKVIVGRPRPRSVGPVALGLAVLVVVLAVIMW